MNCKILLKTFTTKQKVHAVNAGDEWGNTPLHMAALSGKLPIIKLLEKNGSDRRCKNRNDETPLDMA
jgi:uncharacterized protein